MRRARGAEQSERRRYPACCAWGGSHELCLHGSAAPLCPKTGCGLPGVSDTISAAAAEGRIAGFFLPPPSPQPQPSLAMSVLKRKPNQVQLKHQARGAALWVCFTSFLLNLDKFCLFYSRTLLIPVQLLLSLKPSKSH